MRSCSLKGLAAAAIAAVLNKKLPTSAARVGVIVSGGNFDIGKLGNCITACNDICA